MEKITYPLSDEEYGRMPTFLSNEYILVVGSPDNPPPSSKLSITHRFFAYTGIDPKIEISDDFYWVDHSMGRNPSAVGKLSIKSWHVRDFLERSGLGSLDKNIENVYTILDLEPEAIEIVCKHGPIPYDYEILKDLVESGEKFSIVITLENLYKEVHALFILTHQLFNLTVAVNNSKTNPLFALDDYVYSENDLVELYINNTPMPLVIRESITLNI